MATKLNTWLALYFSWTVLFRGDNPDWKSIVFLFLCYQGNREEADNPTGIGADDVGIQQGQPMLEFVGTILFTYFP